MVISITSLTTRRSIRKQRNEVDIHIKRRTWHTGAPEVTGLAAWGSNKIRIEKKDTERLKKRVSEKERRSNRKPKNDFENSYRRWWGTVDWTARGDERRWQWKLFSLPGRSKNLHFIHSIYLLIFDKSGNSFSFFFKKKKYAKGTVLHMEMRVWSSPFY